MDDLQDLQNLCRKAFASTYAFMLVAACYHWNVEDPNFLQYHDLFGKVYTEVDGKIDVFAEQLRGLQTYAPATFIELRELSSIENEPSDETHTPDDMIRYLYITNGLLNTDLINAYTAAERLQEHGMANFLSERMDQHRKHGWMLYASMRA
jgi:DNA-binding ferritin-like protein